MIHAICTRFDKTARSGLAFVLRACIQNWPPGKSSRHKNHVVGMCWPIPVGTISGSQISSPPSNILRSIAKRQYEIQIFCFEKA